jgi:hypothetical protein
MAVSHIEQLAQAINDLSTGSMFAKQKAATNGLHALFELARDHEKRLIELERAAVAAGVELPDGRQPGQAAALPDVHQAPEGERDGG